MRVEVLVYTNQDLGNMRKEIYCSGAYVDSKTYLLIVQDVCLRKYRPLPSHTHKLYLT